MTHPISLPTPPIRLAHCALVLSLCAGCAAARDAEIGIFELKPEQRHEQPAAAGAPAVSAGSPVRTLELSANPPEFCPGECIELIAAAGGGYPPFQYTWELDGAGLSGPGPHHLCPKATATYHVTVIDADFERSGWELGDSVQVTLRADCTGVPAAGAPAPPTGPAPTAPPPTGLTPTQPPTPTGPMPTQPPTPADPSVPHAPPDPQQPGPLALTLQSSNTSVCPGDCVELTASATGGRAPYQYNWELPELSGPGPHRVCPTQTRTYKAFAMDADFESNHLEVGATTRVVVKTDCKP